jgi:uncharacterized protein
MFTPRRAGSATPLLKVAGLTLAGALAGVLGAMAVVSAQVARRVVRPAARLADTEILDVDTAAQTITLERTPDTRLPGRYGLFTEGTADYVKVGAVLAENATTVKRKLLTQIDAESRLSAAAAFSGWYYDDPTQLHLPYSAELIGSGLGPCPAWLFPAPEPTDTWVVQIHGRGSTRAECLRAVPVFRDLGITSLLVSYRNDGEAPRSRTGTYGLGSTEWRDVEAAIGFARRNGARNIILMGWSMGGAIALQLALTSAHRSLIRAVVLESPVIEWKVVLDYQARQQGVPATIAGIAITALGAGWGTPFTRTGSPIPFDRLDIVSRAGELRQPMLILHSDDDGFVPSDASHALAEARPDLVTLVPFEEARHTKLWNYDQERWTRAIDEWVRAQGLATTSPASGS